MGQLDEQSLRREVTIALGTLEANPYGLHLSDIRQVDGRWWVFVEADREPARRAEIWDALADLEQRLEDQSVQVTVAAA